MQKLRGNSSITRLDLSSNDCGDMAAAAVAGMLRVNNTLSVLVSHPSSDVMTTMMGPIFLDLTGCVLQYLEDNVIGDGGGMTISHALSQNSTLRTLSIKSNLLHDATGSAFVAALRGNTGLTELDISWNDINYANHHSIEKLIAEHAERSCYIPPMLGKCEI